jgi:ElaB/YqjD/DUF883 family membrane-anchored ribosome-binding protein
MNATANDPLAAATHNDSDSVEAARAASRQARSAVRREIYILVADVENLLRCVKTKADSELGRVRADVVSALAATKRAVAGRAHQVQRQAHETLEASDRYVHEQPWRVIGVAAICGLIGGLLLRPRGMNGRELS